MAKKIKYVNIEEASDMLNITKNFFKELIYAGIIDISKNDKNEFVVFLEDLPHYINLIETAKVLDLSERTIRRYVKDKKIELIGHKFKSDLKFKPADVERFVKNSRTS